MANKFSLEEYKNRIDMFFPDWNYEILEFNGYKQAAKILCKNCNNILIYKKACDISRKLNVCKCYHKFNNYHEKLIYLGQVNGFTILHDEPNNMIKTIRCDKCNTIMERSLVSLLNTPFHCDKCNAYRKGQFHYNIEEAQQRLDTATNNEYQLLQYNGINKEAVLRHLNCGFIFTIRDLNDIFIGRNRGCPKCYQFKSKGEQKIAAYLDNKNIKYIPQKTFTPLNKSKYRFDFFLPDYNLAIEYQGEQHYRDNSWFKDDLSTIQKRDQIKRQYCQENHINLLEISYKDYNIISQILDSRFNDYPFMGVEESSSK